MATPTPEKRYDKTVTINFEDDIVAPPTTEEPAQPQATSSVSTTTSTTPTAGTPDDVVGHMIKQSAVVDDIGGLGATDLNLPPR